MTWKKRVRPWITISNVVGLLLLAVSISGFVWLRRSGIDAFSREGFEALTTNLGPYGPFIYIVLIALTVVVSQLPGVPLVFAAGALAMVHWPRWNFASSPEYPMGGMEFQVVLLLVLVYLLVQGGRRAAVRA